MKLVTATLGVSAIQSWSVTLVLSLVFPIGKPYTPTAPHPQASKCPLLSTVTPSWSGPLAWGSPPTASRVWSPKGETGVSLLEIHVYHLGVCVSSSNCCFLTGIQISQEADQVVWYSHLFQNFPQFIVIHTVKDFGIVNEAEIDAFLELSCFFYDPTDVGNLISGSAAISKSS